MDHFRSTWTQATPEFANAQRRVAVHSVSHALESAPNRLRTIRFLRSRILYFGTQLPLGWTQVVMLDDQGQNVSDEVRAELRNALAPNLVTFSSEPRPSWLTT